MLNSFSYVLTSNRAASKDQTPSSFSNKVPIDYNFGGAAWGAQINWIQLHHSWLNVPQPQECEFYKFDATLESGYSKIILPTSGVRTTIPPGYYTAESLVYTINYIWKLFAAATGEFETPPQAELESPFSNQIRLRFRKSSGYLIFANLPPQLCQILGVSKDFFFKAAKRYYRSCLTGVETIEANNSYWETDAENANELIIPATTVDRLTDLNANTNEITILCNIVCPSAFGNSYLNKLGTMPINNISNFGSRIYYEFVSAKPIPLNRDHVTEIQIDLIDSNFHHVPMIGGTTLISISFVKLDQI